MNEGRSLRRRRRGIQGEGGEEFKEKEGMSLRRMMEEFKQEGMSLRIRRGGV